MVSKGRMFAGMTVALVTPFKDGEVDYRALRDSVDWQIDRGTPVLSPVGTTGECPTLSHDEHERVIATVVEQVPPVGPKSWPEPAPTPPPKRSG